MSIVVSMVPPDHVATCWPQIASFMDKAAEYTFGRYTSDDIRNCLTDYDYQLWVAFNDNGIKGAVVTNFMTYPRIKVLSMTFCGGVELAEWKSPMLSLLRRFAKDTGCDRIEAVARKGWAKAFEKDGYKANWVTFELPLEGDTNG